MAKIMLAQPSTTQNVCFGALYGLDIIDSILFLKVGQLRHKVTEFGSWLNW